MNKTQLPSIYFERKYRKKTLSSKGIRLVFQNLFSLFQRMISEVRKRSRNMRGLNFIMNRLQSLSSILQATPLAITRRPVAASATALVDSERIDSVFFAYFNQPKLNSMTTELWAQLNELLQSADADPTVKVIVLMGRGRCFSVGADITRFKEQPPLATTMMQDDISYWISVLQNLQTPTIAGVHGFALGGGLEACLNCDLIVADSKAKFGLPEIKVGIMPGAGGTRISRRIGKSRAMSMILTGQFVSAKRLHSWGVINTIVQGGNDPAEKVKEEALKLARRIAQHSTPVIRLAKRTVKRAEEMSLSAGIASHLDLQSALGSYKDAHEGVAAVLEKREPKWKNE